MSAFSSLFLSFLGRAVPVVTMLVLASNATAQETLYRYVDADGRVVYTDRQPPPTAKETQIKRAGGNFVETDKMSASTRQAMERFPITLYAFSCGVLCEDAEALLQKRGVPYTYVNTQDQSGAEKLKKLTGGLQVPVLQVGTDFVKGFNEATWEQKLDGGGYAKDAGVKTSVKHTAAPPPEPKQQESDSDDASPEPDSAPPSARSGGPRT
ncbi:MAG: glutaredoxin family protein [Burkholderiales bacterium]|jgi:glutaredoxin|nr:glutaredoxin family protein [Burkholderiales bacterium]